MAIGGFTATVIYFSEIQARTGFENALLAFGISGLVADTLFTGFEIANLCGAFVYDRP